MGALDYLWGRGVPVCRGQTSQPEALVFPLVEIFLGGLFKELCFRNSRIVRGVEVFALPTNVRFVLLGFAA